MLNVKCYRSLKCRKKTESKTPKLQPQKTEEK